MSKTEKVGNGVPLVNYKNLRTRVIYPLLAAAGLWVCYLWLPPAFTGLSIKRNRDEALTPLMEKAKMLDLSYAQVLTAPGGAEGNPVIWCVQNRGPQLVSVEGDLAKPLSVSNYYRMPGYSGSKHQACTPMLLILEKPEPDRPVKVFFEEAL